MRYVTWIRNGKPKQFDYQIFRWRKKRRLQYRAKKEMAECLEAIVDFHGGDYEAAREWMHNHPISRYQGRTPADLLQNGSLKGVYRELKELKMKEGHESK